MDVARRKKAVYSAARKSFQEFIERFIIEEEVPFVPQKDLRAHGGKLDPKVIGGEVIAVLQLLENDEVVDDNQMLDSKGNELKEKYGSTPSYVYWPTDMIKVYSAYARARKSDSKRTEELLSELRKVGSQSR